MKVLLKPFISLLFIGLLFNIKLAYGAIELAVETNSRSVQQGETIQVSITVGNSGSSASGPIGLQMPYPQNLLTLNNSLISDAGGCSGSNRCDFNSDEIVSWNLGVLPAGASRTVTLPPTVYTNAPDGSITFSAEAFEDGNKKSEANLNIDVNTNTPLMLRIDEDINPVAPGEPLVYTVSYSNRGGASANGTTLRFPLPAGATFVSATDGGSLNGNVVEWNLRTLRAKTGNEQKVKVMVNNGVIPGSLLEVDSATIAGVVNSLPQTANTIAVTRVGNDVPLSLGIELNPDPVQPDEAVKAQITVSNTSNASLFGVILQLRYPDWALTLNNSLISDAGGCPGSSRCDFGADEFVTWSLGNLPQGASRTVELPPTFWSGTPEGTLVTFDAQVREDNGTRVRQSRTIRVNNSPFDITVDEDVNPVAPGEPLVYTISYSNRGVASSTGTMLRFPLPTGVSFVSATDGGNLNGNVVEWNLRTLQAKSGGKLKVKGTVNNSVIPGSLLEVDSATIAGQVNSLPQTADALAVTRVANNVPVVLGMELNPDPVQPDETMKAQLTVSNTSNASLFGVIMQLRYPDWALTLNNSLISDAGGCPGSSRCDFGADEFVTWSLGNLPQGASRTVELPPTFWSGTPEGILVTFDAQVREDNGTRVRQSRTIRVNNSPFDITVDEDVNPVAPGEPLVYTVSYSNRGVASANGTTLRFPLPTGVSFVSTTGGGSLNDNVVEWNLRTLQAKSGGEQKVKVTVNNSAIPGSLLEVDSVTIAGVVNSLPQTADALAVTRVANDVPLLLGIELNPDPTQPGEAMKAQLTVSNTSNESLFGVILQLRYPDWALTLNNSLISDAGGCPGSSRCDFGADEFVTWSLGDLVQGASRTVELPPTFWSGTPEGILIPFEASVDEDNGTQSTSSNTLFIGDDFTPAGPFNGTDLDKDGIFDNSDNCREIPNPDQRDTNNDGLGNICDPDLNNDGVVNAADLALFRTVFFTTDEDADFNGDGNVNAGDLAIMRSFFFKVPGPGASDL